MTRKALVVDDSMLIRHVVCRWLEKRGFAVEAACNGAEALQMLAGASPDLIITDIQMPRMTGPEFITELKLDERTARIPIVVLSSKQSATEALEDRAQATIYKDIDIDAQLQRAVHLALEPTA